jgi:sulfite reductase (NADPH) flavoprotein alpha-component
MPLVQAKKATGRKIYRGKILATVNLNDRGSNKHTRHIEIEVEGDPCSYTPGDSLGVFPKNPEQIVEGILQLTGIDPDKKVSFRGEETSISHLLKNRLNIMYLPERIIQQYARLVQQEIPPTKMGLLELLKIYPVKGPEQFEEALSFMEPSAPRLYSIASAPTAHPGEVHILVARDQFLINQEVKCGLCSGMLTDMQTEDPIEFYIHHNDRFRLPAPDKDIIMIGPGTGIAPFRSFLSERDSAGATGRNWLFFGDQHFTTDFLYQTELQQWLQSGALHNIHVAFSRDQKEKIYVQNKMRQEAASLFSWIESGAHIYVCGAKDPMSGDVENTLVEIIAGQTGKSRDWSTAYLQQLSESGRYLKDVY